MVACMTNHPNQWFTNI